MIGTGTSTDPYIVDNFTDFLTAAAMTDAYIAFDPDAENKVLDLNDTPYADGLTETVFINAAQIRGNGWTIRNFYFTAQAHAIQISGTEIDALHLINAVVSVPQNALIYAPNGMCWKNSSISSVISTGGASGYLLKGTTDAEFINCSFYVQFNGKMTNLFHYGVLNTCNLEMYFTYSGIPFSNTSMKSTSVRGTVYISGSSNLKMIDKGSLDSSYFAVEFLRPEGDTTSPKIWFYADRYPTICFYDADLLGEGVGFLCNNMNAFLGLTTAQCKDAAYLMSIGFPCVEVAS